MFSINLLEVVSTQGEAFQFNQWNKNRTWSAKMMSKQGQQISAHSATKIYGDTYNLKMVKDMASKKSP